MGILIPLSTEKERTEDDLEPVSVSDRLHLLPTDRPDVGELQRLVLATNGDADLASPSPDTTRIPSGYYTENLALCCRLC